jgi:hypothetical protein
MVKQAVPGQRRRLNFPCQLTFNLADLAMIQYLLNNLACGLMTFSASTAIRLCHLRANLQYIETL